MAAQTARYYLERSLVELEDLREQGLFEKVSEYTLFSLTFLTPLRTN